MPYQCKRCGSLSVKHHCTFLTLREAGPCSSDPYSCYSRRNPPTAQPMRQSHDVARVLQPNEPPPPEVVRSRDNTPAWEMDLGDARVVQRENADIRVPCRACGGAALAMTRGLRWSDAERRCVRVQGEALCHICRGRLTEELGEFFPAPPDLPGPYQIVRTRDKKRVSLEQGVTLLCVGGRYTEAKRMKDTGYATVCRLSVA